jgi:hypothetical protein
MTNIVTSQNINLSSWKTLWTAKKDKEDEIMNHVTRRMTLEMVSWQVLWRVIHPEDRGSMLLQNIRNHLPNYLASYQDDIFCSQLFKKSKIILLIHCGGPQGCETSRLPYFLDNRLTDGGEVVSLTRQAISVTGRGGPQGCQTSRLPHILDNRLTDGGEVVNLTRQAIPETGRGGPTGLSDVEASTFSSQSVQRWRSCCQPYAPAAHYPREDTW